LTPTCAGLVERRGLGLGLLKFTVSAKKFFMQVILVELSPATSMQLTLEVCVAAQNREKFTKTFYFVDLGSFKVIDVDTPKKLVARASYDKQHQHVGAYICNHFYAAPVTSQ